MVKRQTGKLKIKKKNKQFSEDKAKKYFKCTDRERAAFEAGIKLGSLYHQFVGTPISKANVNVLEHAIAEGVRIQPFVEDVSVKLERKGLKNKQDQYDYSSLTGNMFNVRLKIKYNESTITARIQNIEDLNYPLMYITSIE